MIAEGAFIDSNAKVEGYAEIGPQAILGKDSQVWGGCVEGVIGDRTKVWRFAHVQLGAIVGNDCMIGQGVFIAPTARVGDRVKVQNHTDISMHVTIEDDAFVGAGVRFCNAPHPTSSGPQKFECITIKKGAMIGSNVSIVGEVTIGEYAVVGAGCVVTKSVPAHSRYLAAGVVGQETYRGPRNG
ncbi:MAG TPA: DapH/DapD/GlmU-related protein [Anaerolineae bacterium]|nr:DapH/DapD/GlmU-related protein [Anaerolineae bacterium]